VSLSGSHLSHLNNEDEDEAEDKADNWARLICPALINFRHHARNQSEIQTVPCSSAMALWVYYYLALYIIVFFKR
jgi:hypothetical protein